VTTTTLAASRSSISSRSTGGSAEADSREDQAHQGGVRRDHAGLDRLTAAGRPVRGVCWYSRGDQYDWDTALVEPVGKVTEVGLFDAARRPRPVADAYARLAAERG